MSDDAEHLALLHFKVDVLERPKYRFVLCAELAEAAQAAEVVDGRAQDVEELAGEGIGALFLEADAVSFREIIYLNYRWHFEIWFRVLGFPLRRFSLCGKYELWECSRVPSALCPMLVPGSGLELPTAYCSGFRVSGFPEGRPLARVSGCLFVKILNKLPPYLA